MKVVLQRVKEAAVIVNQQQVSSIGAGIVALVGIHRDDTDEDMKWTVKKLLNTRIFNANGKNFDVSVVDKGYEILSVSQFTLYAHLKGNKLDFHNAMPPKEAKEFYEKFLDLLGKQYKADKIKDGMFGELMDVDLINDGPVTITFDSRTRSLS